MKLLDNKGMALVMVLSVVLVMVTIAIQLHKNERDNMLNAAAMMDRRTLDQMTVSAVHLAMAVLIKDRMDNDTDSLREDWADEGILKTQLEQIPFDQGTMGLKIIDEMGKIQINALIKQPLNQYDEDVTETSHYKSAQKAIWDRLADNLLMGIELLGEDIANIEETDKETILDSLKDWMDKDDIETPLNGAESDYYEGLDPPYKCKNGPFDHISEVRLVKGITPEIFNGIGDLGGIGDYITVYGVEKPTGQETESLNFDYPGKININTAPLQVLSVMMKKEYESDANALIEYREAMSGTVYLNDLTNPKWYATALSPLGGGANINEDLVTISSNIFRIIATAELNGIKASTTAIIRREQKSESSSWKCKVLNWETE
jgi:general secretion pathway protein K